jgi:chitinase
LADLLVRLSAPSGQTVSARYFTGDDTATAAGGDYIAAGGLLTFAPGETTKTIQVRVSGDLLDEHDETFNVFLGVPQNATFADSRGVVHVQDDDAPPAVSADDVAVTEGDSDAGRTVGVTFRLSSASGLPVTVNYATADGSASAGADYAAASGTVTFAPGELTKTIELRVLGDRSPEADETFFVRLVDSTDSTVADREAVVTIQNDDLPQVEVRDAGRVTEGNAGTTQAVFAVSLTGPAASP